MKNAVNTFGERERDVSTCVVKETQIHVKKKSSSYVLSSTPDLCLGSRSAQRVRVGKGG